MLEVHVPRGLLVRVQSRAPFFFTMKLSKILAWLDSELKSSQFEDVSNNGLQIARTGDEITTVALGVDASVAFLEAAAAAGAQLCVVHHGISWGGGIRRVTGPEYRVIKTALQHNLALYASHLPLDANKKYGNNWEIARFLKLSKIKPAFCYHGQVIGVTGVATETETVTLGTQTLTLGKGQKVGICSGGAGDFAVAAQQLKCDVFVTGEANWADQVAAANMGASLMCCGHYETETFGVSALAQALRASLNLQANFLDRR